MLAICLLSLIQYLFCSFSFSIMKWNCPFQEIFLERVKSCSCLQVTALGAEQNSCTCKFPALCHHELYLVILIENFLYQFSFCLKEEKLCLVKSVYVHCTCSLKVVKTCYKEGLVEYISFPFFFERENHSKASSRNYLFFCWSWSYLMTLLEMSQNQREKFYSSHSSQACDE